jgi:hypothetical protein
MVDGFIPIRLHPFMGEDMHRGRLWSPAFGFGLEVDNAGAGLLVVGEGDVQGVRGGCGHLPILAGLAFFGGMKSVSGGRWMINSEQK